MNDIEKMALQLRELKQRHNALYKELKEVDRQYDELAKIIAEWMKTNGNLESMKLGGVPIRRVETQYPEIEDFDAFWNYVREHDMPYLLQRRPAVTAIREAFDQGNEIPGIELKTKEKIHVS